MAKAYLKKNSASSLTDEQMRAIQDGRHSTLSSKGSRSELEEKILDREKHLKDVECHAHSTEHHAQNLDELAQKTLDAAQGKGKKEKKKKKEKKEKKCKTKDKPPDAPVAPPSPHKDHRVDRKALQDAELGIVSDSGSAEADVYLDVKPTKSKVNKSPITGEAEDMYSSTTEHDNGRETPFEAYGKSNEKTALLSAADFGLEDEPKRKCCTIL